MLLASLEDDADDVAAGEVEALLSAFFELLPLQAAIAKLSETISSKDSIVRKDGFLFIVRPPYGL